MKSLGVAIHRNCTLTVLAAWVLWLPAITIAGTDEAADNALSNAEREAGWQLLFDGRNLDPVSYTHLTLPTRCHRCRSRWSPYH